MNILRSSIYYSIQHMISNSIEYNAPIIFSAKNLYMQYKR